MKIELRKQYATTIQGDNGIEIQVLNQAPISTSEEDVPIGLYRGDDSDMDKIRKLAEYINQENSKKQAIQKKLHKTIGEKFIIELKYLV